MGLSRKSVAIALVIVGAALVVGGVAVWSPPSAAILAGALMAAAGLLLIDVGGRPEK